MPSSRPQHIPLIIETMRRLKPASILDVGAGFGKWGVLFREYADIIHSEEDVERYHKPGWRVRIDCIEGHEPYITDLHRFVYDNVRLGDALELLESGEAYDLIFIGDVIEHFEREVGQRVLRSAAAKANKALLLSTPAFDTPQGPVCGNPLEEHRSHWGAEDFPVDEGWDTVVTPRDIRVAMKRTGGDERFKLKQLLSERPRWVTSTKKAIGRVKRQILG